MVRKRLAALFKTLLLVPNCKQTDYALWQTLQSNMTPLLEYKALGTKSF